MRQYLKIYIWLLILIANSCVPLEQQTSGTGANTASTSSGTALRYEDYVYDPSIKSVRTYVQTGQPNEVLLPPIIPITQEQPIMLEFDQLNNPQQRFLVKFFYCNADWTEARISAIQYMQDYNEFYITDISPSFNSKVPYFHYRFKMPPVKISGNYLLIVTNQAGQNLISRRVLVYENRISIAAKPVLAAGGQTRMANQQIDFEITYHQYPLVNPAQEIKAVIRQNYRWDNAKQNLRPLYVRDTERKLDFNYFDLRNMFPGSNEFRFFDNRTRRSLGQNIASANREVVPEEISLIPDKSRANDAYSQQIDINGKYIIGNREYGSGEVNGDYNLVTFALAANQALAGKVYVFGELSNWQPDPQFELTYDATARLYTGKILLKQGYYNYLFGYLPTGVAKPDEVYLEGSFNLTENKYDILVYYRPPGARTDLLIGYQQVNFNGR